MTKRRLNIGIIGCGRISDLHAPGYENNPDAGIYAVCDIDPETVRQRQQAWSAPKAYSDYLQLLQDPRVDAVEILSPQGLHEQMVRDAAAAGKHIALQKPMTIDLASADRMLKAVDAAGVVFRVTDNYLFYPPIVRARQLIEAGEIGAPCNLRIKLISGSSGGWEIPPAAWQWRMKERAQGRGLQVFDHGHHLWAAAWYLLGEIERVSAWIDSVDGVIDSPATIMWKFREGVRYGSCEYAHATDLYIPSDYYANDEWMEITGSRGILLIRRCTGKIKDGPVLSLFNGQGWQHFEDMETDWRQGFVGATHNFIQAVRGKETPLLSGCQAREILRVNLAISKSARVRREVYPKELDASWPSFYAWHRIRREKKMNRPGFLSVLGWGKKDGRYAGQAKALTLAIPNRISPQSLDGLDMALGLRLTTQETVPETCFSILIQNQTITVNQGCLPDHPLLTLTVPAGTWAAILLKKRTIETAFLQGRLKLEGKAEKALKLKEILKL